MEGTGKRNPDQETKPPHEEKYAIEQNGEENEGRRVLLVSFEEDPGEEYPIFKPAIPSDFQLAAHIHSGMRQYYPILGFARPMPNSVRPALLTGVEKDQTVFFGNRVIPFLHVNMDINNRPSIAAKRQNRFLGNIRTTGCFN